MESVGELNETLQYEELERVGDTTVLFGGDDGIDSLSLVMLITSIEAEVNNRFDTTVTLASEKAMSMRNSPYRNVASLVAFIEQELNDAIAA